LLGCFHNGFPLYFFRGPFALSLLSTHYSLFIHRSSFIIHRSFKPRLAQGGKMAL